jgi:microcompartment protein CcmL/EutN
VRHALGIIEVGSVAHGIWVADQLLKEAPVELAAATPSTPGRFFISFWGDEASVAFAHRRGRDVAGTWLVDDLLLSVVDAQVIPALRGPVKPDHPDAIGVFECSTAVGTVEVADAISKGTSISLIEIVVSRGLAGKGFVTLSGAQADVEDARRVAGATADLVEAVTIANPDPALLTRVLDGAWGELEGRRLY